MISNVHKKGNKWALSLGLALALCVTGCVKLKPDPTIVKTSLGTLHGEFTSQQQQGDVISELQDVVSFKAIPFAQPPIGALRWAPPQPIGPWEGQKDAKVAPPACMQQITAETREVFKSIVQSEDCLYLNIYAPVTALDGDAKKPLPVLFLIHPGGRTVASASLVRADIEAYNRQGIVVVVPQYRLGIFSFMAHPELSAESPHNASGNYGVLDLVEALNWVQSHIASFGGDPNSVTISGPSGGGTATGTLLASPLTQGLFHRAATMCSNAGISRMHSLKQPVLDQPSAETLGLEFAGKLNAASIADLRNMSAETIQSFIQTTDLEIYDFPSGAGDVIDGWVFPQSIIEAHRLGTRHDVPVLVGFNADEASTFARAGLVGEIPLNSGAYEEGIKQQYGDLSPRVLELYPADNPVASIYAAARDRIAGYSVQTLARHSHKITSPTYVYYMAHSAPDGDTPVAGTPVTRGVAHCTDYRYFFDWYQREGADEADRALAATMSSFLINFIKTGNPNQPEINQIALAQWKPYEQSEKPYMHFTDGEARPSQNLHPGMWELYERVRQDNRQKGRFRHWLGGWASDGLLRKNGQDLP